MDASAAAARWGACCGVHGHGDEGFDDAPDRGDDQAGPTAKAARCMALSVNTVIGPSTETNYEVVEEPLDLCCLLVAQLSVQIGFLLGHFLLAHFA